MDRPGRNAARSTPRVAVVVARFNATVTGAMLNGALAEYESRGGGRAGVAVFYVAGSFELPAIALAAAGSGRFDAVVALGCLIRGQTRHDRFIAEAVAKGLTDVTLKTGIPVAFGVLTVNNAAQARARAGGRKGNKGADAMGAAMEAAQCIAAVRAGDSSWPGSRVATRRVEDKASRVGGGA